MSQKLHDLSTRVTRTFAQGAVGAFVLSYARPLWALAKSFASLGPGDNLPPYPDLNFFRNMLFAMFAGGVIACVSIIWNAINDYLGWGNNIPLLGKPVDRAIGDQALGETKP